MKEGVYCILLFAYNGHGFDGFWLVAALTAEYTAEAQTGTAIGNVSQEWPAFLVILLIIHIWLSTTSSSSIGIEQSC